MKGDGAPKRFSWFDTTNRLRVLAGQRRLPLIATFELTARCNLSCNLCFVRRDAADRAAAAREIGAAAWIDMALQIREEGALFLLLTGGEPLLRPDFQEIYEALCRMGFVLTLYTNATLIGEQEARLFARLPPAKAVVTLYGASPETYGKVCGNPAAFDRATAGVRRLVAAGVHTEVRSTISRDNVGDIEALHCLAFELVGNRAFETSLTLTPPVRGACTKAATCRLSPKEIAALGAKGEGVEPDPGVEGAAAMTVSRLSGAINRPPAGPIDYSALPPMFCSGGRSSFWVAWDGRMLPCALMDRPFTQPFDTGFSPAWRLLVEETDRIPGAEDCRSCADRGHCSVCPGRLQAETGSFTKPAPFLCELARRVHEQEAAAQ